MSEELKVIDQESEKERRKEIARLLYEGEKRGSDICNHIEKKYKVKRDEVLEDLRLAKEDLRLHREKNLIYVIHDHMERYEYLYNKFIKMGRTDLQNKALKQKEALSGIKKILSEESTSDAEKDEMKSKFNWDKLSKEEKTKFKDLLVLAKKSGYRKEKEKNSD